MGVSLKRSGLTEPVARPVAAVGIVVGYSSELVVAAAAAEAVVGTVVELKTGFGQMGVGHLWLAGLESSSFLLIYYVKQIKIITTNFKLHIEKRREGV